jgi:hypothetical protein
VRTGRFLPIALGVGAAFSGQAALPSAAVAATSVSTNWGGYAATASTAGRFRRVVGTWRVPSVNCSPGTATYSAEWVGLGGFVGSSRSLEQTGTEVDCSRTGRAVYSAWYELVPALAKGVRMKVHAGDAITAAVSVRGKRVSLDLRNRTTGAHFAKGLSMSSPDVTSAEWIVEAPEGCDSSGNCTLLPLANFGSVPFSQARATTATGHSGSVSDASWSATKVVLNQAGGGSGRVNVSSAPGALASALSAGGSAFTMTYVDQTSSLGKATTRFPALARRSG